MSKEHLDYCNLVFFPLCVIQYDFLRQQFLAKSYKACIILHNMVIKDVNDMTSACFDSREASETLSPVLPSNLSTEPADCLAKILQRNATISALNHTWPRLTKKGFS
jgi:hypothetical protein